MQIAALAEEIEELKRRLGAAEAELASAREALQQGDARAAEKDAEILRLNRC
jgi:predicted  nucleic acid-binding Zn-ribbon protein